MNRFVCMVFLLACACDGETILDGGSDAGPDAPRDLTPGFWPGTLAPTSALAPLRGRSIARTVVHLHSPLSHDACDERGWADGALADPTCLQHLRDSMCALHLDAAMLTDHAPHVNEVPLERGLWIADGDEAIENGAGEVIASRMACADGHRVLLTAGSENTLMPIGLERHPGDPGDPAALEALYDGSDPAAIAAFRAAGALVWQAHTEGVELDVLRARDLDGLEIYNLHANVAPDIRRDHLGLPPSDFFPALFEFTMPRFRLPPNLAVLSFLAENQPALDKWDALLAEGVRVTGTGGCDAHENAFPMELTDGERADSYRRMMMWIQNQLLVDEVTPQGIDEALERGRLYVTFEIFGTPVGFDFVASAGDSFFEMGEDAPLGASLRVVRPSLPEDWPSDPPPVLTLRIVRSTADGAVEVASGSGETLEYVAADAGSYRAEVRMIPEHAREALGARANALIREYVWVYSNPIFVGDE